MPVELELARRRLNGSAFSERRTRWYRAQEPRLRPMPRAAAESRRARSSCPSTAPLPSKVWLHLERASSPTSVLAARRIDRRECPDEAVYLDKRDTVRRVFSNYHDAFDMEC